YSFDILGYFGIDFIIKGKNILFIEINPRLTTSYLGLRNVLDQNPAKLIYNAKTSQFNGGEINLKGNSLFRKLDLRYLGECHTQEIKETIIPEFIEKVPELITPPISIGPTKENQYSCFVSTKEKNLKNSKKKFKEIISTLNDFNFFKIEQKRRK
ncbi:MAG: ATP-grasp domain-containing protein, partial [Promethearchaeota archaeon]